MICSPSAGIGVYGLVAEIQTETTWSAPVLLTADNVSIPRRRHAPQEAPEAMVDLARSARLDMMREAPDRGSTTAFDGADPPNRRR
jgi:hypothetical protein